jgi:hypothetical protein
MNGGLTFNAAIGWGVIFLILIAATDVPMTQRPAAMLAWLFLVSVLFKFGPDAFKTIQTVNQTPVPSVGTGPTSKSGVQRT